MVKAWKPEVPNDGSDKQIMIMVGRWGFLGKRNSWQGIPCRHATVGTPVCWRQGPHAHRRPWHNHLLKRVLGASPLDLEETKRLHRFRLRAIPPTCNHRDPKVSPPSLDQILALGGGRGRYVHSGLKQFLHRHSHSSVAALDGPTLDRLVGELGRTEAWNLSTLQGVRTVLRRAPRGVPITLALCPKNDTPIGCSCPGPPSRHRWRGPVQLCLIQRAPSEATCTASPGPSWTRTPCSGSIPGLWRTACGPPCRTPSRSTMSPRLSMTPAVDGCCVSLRAVTGTAPWCPCAAAYSGSFG